MKKQRKKTFNFKIRAIEATHFHAWVNYFQNKGILFWQIISDIEKLVDNRNFTVSKIPIHFVIAKDHKEKEISAWFSWTPKKSFITMEIPLKVQASKNLFPWGILTHEFFHLILRENRDLFSHIDKISKKYSAILEKASKGIISNRMFLEELLISSFIPEGYLGEKYLEIKISAFTSKRKDLVYWRKLAALKMRKYAKEYLIEKRRIDKKYMLRIIEVISSHEK